jgi:hypothetical protein
VWGATGLSVDSLLLLLRCLVRLSCRVVWRWGCWANGAEMRGANTVGSGDGWASGGAALALG